MGKVLSYAGRAYEQALTSRNHEMVEYLPGVFALAGKDGNRVGKYPDGPLVGLRRPTEDVRTRARKQWGVYQADISRRMVDMQARRLNTKGLGYNKPMTAEQLEERALHQFLLSHGVGPRTAHSASQLEQVTQEQEYSGAGRLPNWEYHLLYGPPNLAGFRAALEYGVREMTQSPEAAIGTGVAQWKGASLDDAISWGRAAQAVVPFLGAVGGVVARVRQAGQAVALDAPSARMIEPVTKGTMSQAVDPGHRLTIETEPKPLGLPEFMGNQYTLEPVPEPSLQPPPPPLPPPLVLVPPVTRTPPSNVRGRAQQRAQAFASRFRKVDGGSFDQLAQMFGFTGGWTLDNLGQPITKTRATSTELQTVIAYHQRPSVARIRLINPHGQVSPDLGIDYVNGSSEVVEVTTVTGARRGERAEFRDRPPPGSAFPTKAMPASNQATTRRFAAAIRHKLGHGQLHSPGALVVGSKFETSLETVQAAMTSTQVLAMGNANLNRIEFHIPSVGGPVLQVTFARSSGFATPEVRPLLTE